MKKVARHCLVIVLVAAWVGAVVYPDPRPFFNSISRLRNPPVDAGAAAQMAAALPDDYKAVEGHVRQYVPWKSAWTIYGLPWYFPTVKEVIADQAGDCQAQTVLMASILEAKGMPYTLRYSFDHVWVDYPGKEVTALEDPATSFVSDEGEGWLAGLPEKFPVWTILKQRVGYHWTPMPFVQKLLIILGTAAIIGYGERRFVGRLRRLVLRETPAWAMPPAARRETG
ncbi:MAG: transglutaminase domain-containing protein [Thermoleophilia bacterium]|nr:transglutaminase domain-containing protein [Thermoleophilia bacterium]